jgi:nitrite reductase (NADH) small subunit
MTTATCSRTLVNLGPLQRIPPGEGRTFTVDAISIAVFRTRQGEVFATQASCPHRRGPMADGITGDGRVVCPLHAYQFELATGAPIGNDCAALETYPISVDAAGNVLLELP